MPDLHSIGGKHGHFLYCIVIFAQMRLFVLLILILSACHADTPKKTSQPYCVHPLQLLDTSSDPETVFTLAPDKMLALWRVKQSTDSIPGETMYSDFTISECASGNIVGKWGEGTRCTVEMSSDTLIIKQFSYIALSPNLDMIDVPWQISKYCYIHGQLSLTKHFNNEIHYSAEQINRAFEHLDTTQWQTQAELSDSRKSYRMMRFASQMMVAAISGSPRGMQYFLLVKERFKPRGQYALWYAEMENILQFAHADTVQSKYTH